MVVTNSNNIIMMAIITTNMANTMITNKIVTMVTTNTITVDAETIPWPSTK